MTFPFEMNFNEVQVNLETCIDEIFGCLDSEFLIMPKGAGFVDFETFEAGYCVIPNEFNPQIVIEAKLTEDDGTARDKITRVQHLGELSLQGRPHGQPRFEVVACIAGRGFGVRREDMKKLLLSTRGKVFTLQNMRQLVECTRLSEFRSRQGTPESMDADRGC